MFEFPFQKVFEKTEELSKKRIGISCSYIPEELIYAAGFIPHRVMGEVLDMDRADALLYNNLCFYVKAFFEIVSTDPIYKTFAGFIFSNSCDSMERLYDAFNRFFSYEILEIFDVPRNINKQAEKFFYNGLLKLWDKISHKYDISNDSLLKSIELYNKKREYLRRLYELQIQKSIPLNLNKIIRSSLISDVEVFNSYLNLYISEIENLPELEKRQTIIITGSISDKETLSNIIEEDKAFLVFEDTCVGLRYMDDDIIPDTDIMMCLAKRYLNRISCARMNDTTGNMNYSKKLIEKLKPVGIIYNLIKFCDPYSCDVSLLPKIIGDNIPLLVIESDYSSGNIGQYKTRIKAFLEILSKPVSNNGTVKIHTKSKPNGKAYFAGIDSGSLSTDCVIIDKEYNIISKSVVYTGPNVRKSALESFEIALNQAKLKPSEIGFSLSTGYGRDIIDFRNDSITEITCHAKGAFTLFPQTRTIIDIGGQDSKVIKLNEKGEIENFAMNDKCAAGTGRFLEVMAKTLHVELDKMGEMALKSKTIIPMSSMCTVFAESEVVSLLAEGHTIEDIINSLCNAISKRVLGLMVKTGKSPAFTMTGGVAKNIGVVKLLEEKLESKISIFEDPQIVGAYGAAIFAYEKYNR